MIRKKTKNISGSNDTIKNMKSLSYLIFLVLGSWAAFIALQNVLLEKDNKDFLLLSQNITNVDMKVTKLDMKVTKLDTKLIMLDGKVTSLDKDISSQVTELKIIATQNQKDVAGLKEDVVGLKEDVVGLKEDVVVLKVKVDFIQKDMVEIKEKMDKGFSNISAKLDQLASQRNQTLEEQDQFVVIEDTPASN